MNVRDAQSIQGLQTTQKPQIMQRPIMFQNPQLFVQTGSQKIPSPLERVPLTFFEEEFKKYSLLSFFSRGRVSFAYKDGSYYMYSVSSVSQEVKLLDVT